MKRLDALGRFAWDFVVGDDWRIAAGVVASLALAAGLSALDVAAWWVMPARRRRAALGEPRPRDSGLTGLRPRPRV